MSVIADELRERTLSYGLRVVAFCRRLPENWVTREIGRQLLRAGMGVAGNYWSSCRGRSKREFVAKLGVAVDEADESVLWLTVVVRSGIRDDVETKALLGEGREIRAILSKSHKTARENRKQERRARQRQLTNSPTRQFTKSTGGLP
jgi:four helix bundle protein